MTPFVDEEGGARIVDLFRCTGAAVRRELIVRNGLPAALVAKAVDLADMGVRVYDFRISREERGHNETFHAKVVCADEGECYVGSSNMTKWSFSYSLELGFHARGRAASRVAQILDAVVHVSVPLSV